jgi:hypothetical protein
LPFAGRALPSIRPQSSAVAAHSALDETRAASASALDARPPSAGASVAGVVRSDAKGSKVQTLGESAIGRRRSLIVATSVALVMALAIAGTLAVRRPPPQASAGPSVEIATKVDQPTPAALPSADNEIARPAPLAPPSGAAEVSSARLPATPLASASAVAPPVPMARPSGHLTPVSEHLAPVSEHSVAMSSAAGARALPAPAAPAAPPPVPSGLVLPPPKATPAERGDNPF